MPVHFMRTMDLVIVPLQAFLVAGSMMMSIYYTPLIFQFVRGDSPLMAGVRILPLISMIVFGCLFNGVAMPKFGYYMPWFVVGNALLVAGAALMSMRPVPSCRLMNNGTDIRFQQQPSLRPSPTPPSTDTRCSSVWASEPSRAPVLALPVPSYRRPRLATWCQS
jgi:hypothetical protein